MITSPSRPDQLTMAPVLLESLGPCTHCTRSILPPVRELPLIVPCQVSLTAYAESRRSAVLVGKARRMLSGARYAARRTHCQPVATTSLLHGFSPNAWDQYTTSPGLVLIAVITTELLVTEMPGLA
jgi:hypothetical protein